MTLSVQGGQQVPMEHDGNNSESSQVQMGQIPMSQGQPAMSQAQPGGQPPTGSTADMVQMQQFAPVYYSVA